MVVPGLSSDGCGSASTFVWLCLFRVNFVCIFVPGLPAQISIREATSSLSAFERQYLNTSFHFTVNDVYVRGPAWADGTTVKNGQGLFKHNQETGWHYEQDYSIRNFYHSIAYSVTEDMDPGEISDRMTQQHGKILTGLSTVNVTVRENGPTLTGTIKSNKGRINWDGQLWMSHLNFLFGHERYLAGCDLRLSDMLSNYECKVVRDNIDGKEASRVSTSTIFGNLDIWFSNESNPRPIRVVLSRESDDFVMLDPKEYRVSGITGHYCGDNGPTLTRMIHTFSDLEYCKIDGKQFCTGFTFTKQETDADGQEALNVTEVSITDIDLNPPEIKSHSVDFELFTVPEGTRFWADDSPNIPYIVHDKKVAKVVNEKTLESLEGIRFAMPSNRFRWWLRVLAVLMVTVISVAIFMNHRSRNNC